MLWSALMLAQVLAADPADAVARLERLTAGVPGAPVLPCGDPVVRAVRRLEPALDPALHARVRAALWGRGGPGRDLAQCTATASHHLESEHFSVQWGDAADTTEADHQAMAQAFEDALATYRANGFADPLGIDQTYLRVFVGNSGDDVPGIAGALGYTVSGDVDCPYAYIVMDPSAVADETLRLDVSAHELFHAVQFALDGGFVTEDWYSEATAAWAENFVHPDLNVYAGFLTLYAGQPFLRMDDNADGLRAYGMFIVPQFFAEYRGGFESVRWFWENTGRFGGTVAVVMEAWLQDQQGLDETFADAVAEFSARNILWDYADGDLYGSLARQVVPFDPANRDLAEILVVERVQELPAAATRVVDLAPDTYGTAYLSFRLFGLEGPNNRLHIDLEGESGDWVVGILEQRTDGEKTVRTQRADGAHAEVVVDSAGTRVSDVVVGFTLVSEEGGPVPFTWSATLGFQPPTTEDVLDDALDVLDEVHDASAASAEARAAAAAAEDHADHDDRGSGCASPAPADNGLRSQNSCATSTATGTWFWAGLLATVVLARNRRRRS